MNHHLCLSIAAVLGLLSPLAADEVRLKDGRVLIGTVTTQGGNVEIATHDGIVRVAASEIESQRSEAVLRDQFRALAQQGGDSAFAQLQLATQARAWGLAPELWRHLGRAASAAQSGDPSAWKSRLDTFASQLEPELLPRKFRTAKTSARVHELLQQLAGKTEEVAGRRAAILTLLAREPEADKDLQREAQIGRAHV